MRFGLDRWATGTGRQAHLRYFRRQWLRRASLWGCRLTRLTRGSAGVSRYKAGAENVDDAVEEIIDEMEEVKRLSEDQQFGNPLNFSCFIARFFQYGDSTEEIRQGCCFCIYCTTELYVGVSFRTVEASKFSWGIRIAEGKIRIDPPVGCSDGQVLGDAPDAFLGDAPGQVLEGVPEESV